MKTFIAAATLTGLILTASIAGAQETQRAAKREIKKEQRQAERAQTKSERGTGKMKAKENFPASETTDKRKVDKTKNIRMNMDKDANGGNPARPNPEKGMK